MWPANQNKFDTLALNPLILCVFNGCRKTKYILQNSKAIEAMSTPHIHVTKLEGFFLSAFPVLCVSHLFGQRQHD